MHIFRGFSRKQILASVLSVVAFAISPFALANIISGVSTSGISAHVTYTQLILNTPSVSAGDVMLASIAVPDGSADNITAPAGWTLLARTDNDVNVTLISYWKIAGASEPNNYTWTIDKQTRAVGGITPYTGVDTSGPIDAYASNTGFSTTATTTSITTRDANEEVVSLFATNVGKTFSVPSGMTQKYSLSHGTTTGPSTAAFDELQASAGGTGSISSTIDTVKRYWAAQQIALRVHYPGPISMDSHAGTSTSMAYQPGPYSMPFTVSGNDRMLIVPVTISDPSNPDVLSSATYDGRNLTLIAKEAAYYSVYTGHDEVYLFAMVAPPVGTHDVVITTSETPGSVQIHAANYVNVAQVIPTNYLVNQSTNNGNLSVGPLLTSNNSWVAGVIDVTNIDESSSGVIISPPNVIRDDLNYYHTNTLVDSNGPTGGTDTVYASGGWPDYDVMSGIFAELAPAQ